MPLPALTKTWQFRVNEQSPGDAVQQTQSQNLMFRLKDALIGGGSWTDSAGAGTTPTNNWTVSSSSNSSVANSSDNWAGSGNLIWASGAGAHSWIVLRQTAIATNFELCIDLNDSTANTDNARIVISPSAAFTGGTTTARPTATDEIVLINVNDWGGVAATGTPSRLHVIKSSDGTSTRVFICRAGVCVGMWLFELPINVVSGWTNPSFSLTLGHFASTVQPTTLLMLNQTNARGRGNALTMSMRMNAEAWPNSAGLITQDIIVANEISSEWPLLPLGISSITVGARGRHGSLSDMWLGQDSLADATTYPLDGSKQLVHFGRLVVPWNQSVPVFTG